MLQLYLLSEVTINVPSAFLGKSYSEPENVILQKESAILLVYNCLRKLKVVREKNEIVEIAKTVHLTPVKAARFDAASGKDYRYAVKCYI